MQNEMLERLMDFPVIAAAKSQSGLKRALQSPCSVVFLLFGSICNIGELAEAVRSAGKLAVVHADLIDGLSPREVSARFLKETAAADGVISTKPQLLRCARDLGLITVQRFFLLDSMSLENAEKHLAESAADFIEILPGAMPKVIRGFARKTGIPLIAGGLIADKEDVVSALGAGATGVSTTREALWFQ